MINSKPIRTLKIIGHYDIMKEANEGSLYYSKR